ncbi:MAG: LPS export ABC transporter permease LptG [Candidatus Azotimanducaceae bacterium WSBS_2022_MAG_OTU7]
MSKLDNYLGLTVATMTLLASAGLISLFVIFTFLDQMNDIKQDYDLIAVIKYVSYSIPRMFYETVPFAALIGSLTGLGILASNSELIIMRTAGISTWQIAIATMKPALAFVIAGLLVGELILPDFERTARVSRENATEGTITPQGGFWYREGNRYMHFGTVSPEGVLRNINQYFLGDEQQLKKTLWAESATHIPPVENEGTSYWRMENVIVTQLGTSNKREHHRQLKWQSELTPDLLSTEILVEPDRMSINELRKKISYMESQGLNTDKFQLGFWTKAFQPIASLSLVFVAISFIFGPLRETTMGMRVVSGLLTGIVFKLVQDLLSPASLVFGFTPLIATTTPILICLVSGYLLLKRAN